MHTSVCSMLNCVAFKIGNCLPDFHSEYMCIVSECVHSRSFAHCNTSHAQQLYSTGTAESHLLMAIG